MLYIKYLAFPIIHEPFLFFDVPSYFPKQHIDFSKNKLRALLNTIKNEVVNFNTLRNFSQSGGELNEIFYANFIDEESLQIQDLNKVEITNYIQDKERVSQIMHDFNNISRDYLEIFSRDSDAFNGYSFENKEAFNSTLYVVVLLIDNEYYGHVYTWISPIDSELMFILGIRTKIMLLDNIKIKNISRIIFEGVRQFAKISNCNRLCIETPTDKMYKISKHYGFKNINVDPRLCGISLIRPDPINIYFFEIRRLKSMVYDNLDIPLYTEHETEIEIE